MLYFFYFSLMIITKGFFFMGNFLFFNVCINDSGGRDWCENKQYIYIHKNIYAKSGSKYYYIYYTLL